MSSGVISVAVVDDDTVLKEGLCRVFAKPPLACVPRTPGDLISGNVQEALFVVVLRGRCGESDWIRRLLEHAPDARIVVLGEEGLGSALRNSLELGASCALYSNIRPDSLFSLLQLLATESLTVVEKGLKHCVEQRSVPAASPTPLLAPSRNLTASALSAREADILAHIVRGDGFSAAERSPLLGAGKSVTEGMYLVSIAGTPCKTDTE